MESDMRVWSFLPLDGEVLAFCLRDRVQRKSVMSFETLV